MHHTRGQFHRKRRGGSQLEISKAGYLLTHPRILLVLISLITSDVEVQRSRNNYFTPILTDLVRIDDILIYSVYV